MMHGGFLKNTQCSNIPNNKEVLVTVCNLTGKDYFPSLIGDCLNTKEDFIRIWKGERWLSFSRNNYYLNGYTYIDYNDFLNLFKESIKMKQVVFELPNQKLEVTYKWLKEQKCCESAIDWFVEKFGNKADYDTVLEAAKKERNDWSWLVDSKKYLTNKDGNCEYVYINDIKVNKIYVSSDGNWKLHRNINDQWSFIQLNSSNCHAVGCSDTAKEAVEQFMIFMNHVENVYEFDTFNDFVKWYIQDKKIK